jgi:pilus assembly protein CpaB
MRRGGRILIVLGLFLGVMTAIGTFAVLGNTPTTTQKVATKSVVVAQQTVPERAEITADAVGVQEWPESAVPAGALDKTDAVIGKIALHPIYPGQIILPQMIVVKGTLGASGSNASLVIPEGKVAMAFSISDLTSVANAIQTGDTIDMLLTLQPGSLPATTGTAGQPAAAPGNAGLPVTQVMLQDVLIIQIGSWAVASGNSQNAPAAGIVTFALDRQDALALKAARENGSIDFVLRKSGDHKIATTEPVTLQYLNKRFNFNLAPAITK